MVHPLPEANVPGLLPDVDRDGLLEYSVVYTDRSINHMSQRFQHVMRDISAALKKVYNAQSVVIVPAAARSAWKPLPVSSRRTANAW